MARISLKEAYDNRDVIAWLVKHEDEIDELMDILKDINPSGDLTNIVTKTGDQTIDGIKTFIGKIVADCDIIQNGGNYETHAEQVFTTNDYIVMRDGAVSGLGTGQFSGFQVKKYNGSDDGRLVIDNAGVARVGDIGDEQPLLTRSESGQLNNGDLLQWNSTSQKAVSASLNTSQIVRGSGNIGSDTKPIKVVNGVATAVSYDLVKAEETVNTGALSGNLTGNFSYAVKNGMCTISIWGKSINSVSSYTTVATDIPKALVSVACPVMHDGNGSPLGLLYINTTEPTKLAFSSYTTTTDHVFISMTYPIDE